MSQADMDRIIEEYRAATDEGLVNFAQSIRSGNTKNAAARNFSIGSVSDHAATDIAALIGIDVTGYRHTLKGVEIIHIEKRHGENGEHDQSMADITDYGRIGYILNNYDTVTLLHNAKGEIVYTTGYPDGNNNPSPMIRYEKRVNGTYCVVEAVPDSKAKVLRIISAYKENVESGDGHVLNMATKAPQLTSEQLGLLRSTPPHATIPT